MTIYNIPCSNRFEVLADLPPDDSENKISGIPQADLPPDDSENKISGIPQADSPPDGSDNTISRISKSGLTSLFTAYLLAFSSSGTNGLRVPECKDLMQPFFIKVPANNIQAFNLEVLGPRCVNPMDPLNQDPFGIKTAHQEKLKPTSPNPNCTEFPNQKYRKGANPSNITNFIEGAIQEFKDFDQYLNSQHFSCYLGKKNQRLGKFQILGGGVVKRTFTHDDYPSVAFKINNKVLSLIIGHSLQQNVKNAGRIEEVIKKYGYKYLITSQPILFKKGDLELIFENEQSFINYETAENVIPQEIRQRAEEELCHLVGETHLTDINLKETHNVAYIKDENGEFKLCLFDFDMVSPELKAKDPIGRSQSEKTYYELAREKALKKCVIS